LFTEAFVQHPDHLAEMARQVGVDEELLATLSAQAVAPLLRAYAERLLPMVERLEDGSPEEVLWQQGYCPVCGGWPVLAELRGVELAQYLRCAACGSGWRARRLFCPYCGNDDYRQLQTLAVEGEQRFRVSVCERCRGYLKVGNAFDPPPAELLALDDVASMHLDVIAIERGYRRPVGSGFAIELALPDEEWADEA
jgi:FdhE protein